MAERRAAADLEGRDRLRAVAPDFGTLFERRALAGPSLAIQVTRAIKLLDLYGDGIFAAAVAELVARGLRDNGALAVACDRLRRDQRRPAGPGAACVVVLVDRFAQHCHRVDIDADSWRAAQTSPRTGMTLIS